MIEPLNAASGMGYLDMLKWVYSKSNKLLPRTSGANKAAINGHTPVLERLASKKVYPDQVGLNDCVKLGKVEGLFWMALNVPNMAPSPEAIIQAAQDGHLGIIVQIHRTRPDLLDYPALLAAAKSQSRDLIVNFLETNLPNETMDVV
jgi:hypothetical protein